MKESLFFMLLTVVAVSSLSRALLIPRGRWVKGDSLYHLSVAREVRKLGHLPVKIDRFLVPETYSYPPLHHMLISKIPERWDIRTQKIGFAYDAVTTFIVGYAGYSLVGWEVGLISAVIYMTSPFPLTTCLATSPQPLGVMFVTLFAFASIALQTAIGQAAVSLILLSGLAASGGMLSHRSTAQAMVGVMAAGTLLFRSFVFLGPFLIGLAVSLALFRGRFLVQVREHIEFVVSNARYQVGAYSKMWKEGKVGRILGVHFLPRIVLANFPLLLLVPAFLVFVPGAPPPLLAWTAGVAAMYLLWIPGRGYRQLAVAVPPLSIIAAGVIVASPLSAFALLGAPLAFAGAKIYRTVLPGKIFVRQDSISACEAINKDATDGDMALSIPLTESYTPLYFTRCKILEGSGGDPRGLLFNRGLEKLIEEDGGVKIVGKYGPRFVLRRKDSNVEIKGTVTFENGEYEIIEPGSV